MNVLVIGSGGREHAIVWAVKKSPLVSKIYCAPGNAGIASIAECVPLKADEHEQLKTFAQKHSIDLTIVGSEGPLVAGIVDLFMESGLSIFGPGKAAARIEGSKIFLKDFLARHSIPTAEYRTFNESEYDDALRYVTSSAPPFVIKTDGLAAGKGVTICVTTTEAIMTLKDYFQNHRFGAAGSNIVIEEFMTGEEASVFAMCDGNSYVLLPSAQDHKRIGNGDTGKNTGGMGAYAPAPVVTDEILARVKKEIIEPTLAGMQIEGFPYRGCLYVGLMVTAEGPKVVEFNCRLGDPETQAVLPLIESDPFKLFQACAEGNVSEYTLTLKPSSSVCVVTASEGYPDEYQSGKKIEGIEEAETDAVVFHAGTSVNNNVLVTSGGRVLGVTAVGPDLKSAIETTYNAVSKIRYDGIYYRNDIGSKGLQTQ